MLFKLLYVCFLLGSTSVAQVAPVVPPAAPETDPKNPGPPAVHYVIERRAGAFAPNWTSNLPYLAEQLKIAEARFDFTRREVKGNKIVRVPKEKNLGGGVTGKLLGEYGRNGNWYARMKIGTPPQKIQLDLDMLTRDFSVTTTSSELGSRFEDFFSKTYGISPSLPLISSHSLESDLDMIAPNQLGINPFPNCAFPADNVLLPTVNRTRGISFTHCKPRRQSRDTLLPSGALFGLAPSTSLSQFDPNLPTLIGQLVEGGLIKDEVFSLTLISGEKGILSLGGTIQQQVEIVEGIIESTLHTPNQIPLGSGEKSQQSQEIVSGQILGAAAPPPAPGRGERPGGAATKGSSVLLNALNQDDPNEYYDDGDDYEDEDEQYQNEKRTHEPQSPSDTSPHILSKRDEDGSAQKVPTFDDLNPFNRAGRMKQKGQHQPSWRDGWKWSPVEGAAGWWQILLRGIWADQVKVMKNQPCIIDVSAILLPLHNHLHLLPRNRLIPTS